MKIELVDHNKMFMPKLREVLGGAMVRYQNHFYIKLDKKKMGQGNNMSWTPGHSILINPKYGSMRSVHSDTRVEIMEQVGSFEVCILTNKSDCYGYLRNF